MRDRWGLLVVGLACEVAGEGDHNSQSDESVVVVDQSNYGKDQPHRQSYLKGRGADSLHVHSIGVDRPPEINRYER